MKILSFAASNSSQSINKQLVCHAGELLVNEINSTAQIELLDLNDYEMPIYSFDREKQDGVPALAEEFIQKIGAADGLLISLAEHNGHYTAAYKNLFDWASRINSKVYQGKRTVLLSTSPGKGGGASVMKAALDSAVFFDMNVVGSLSVGSFNDVFVDGVLQGAASDELRMALYRLLS